MRPRLDVYAPQWGSTVTIPDDPSFTPRYTLIHWGGLTRHIPPEDELARLRSWQRTHLNRGFSDIAYQIAVGDSGLSYEGRSWRSGGHTSTKKDKTPEGDSYNVASVGIVWIGGQNAGTPSQAAQKTMKWLCDKLGFPIKGHRTIKQENGSWTACPGDDWLNWIDTSKEDFMKLGDSGINVEKWQDYLNRWLNEYRIAGNPLKKDGAYGPVTVDRTISFQRWANIEPTGQVGYFEALTMGIAIKADKGE